MGNKVLITGGAGFIGCNTAKRYMERGDSVIVIDNLSRKGTDINLEWLQKQENTFKMKDKLKLKMFPFLINIIVYNRKYDTQI